MCGDHSSNSLFCSFIWKPKHRQTSNECVRFERKCSHVTQNVPIMRWNVIFQFDSIESNLLANEAQTVKNRLVALSRAHQFVIKSTKNSNEARRLTIKCTEHKLNSWHFSVFRSISISIGENDALHLKRSFNFCMFWTVVHRQLTVKHTQTHKTFDRFHFMIQLTSRRTESQFGLKMCSDKKKTKEKRNWSSNAWQTVAVMAAMNAFSVSFHVSGTKTDAKNPENAN